MKTRSKLIIIQIFTLVIILLSYISNQHIQLREKRIYIASKTKSDELIIDNVLKFNKDRYLEAAKTNSCWNEIVDFVLKPDSGWAQQAIGEIVFTFNLNYAGVFDVSGNRIYEIYEKTGTHDNDLGLNGESIRLLFNNGPFCHFFLKYKTGFLELFGSTIVTVDDKEHKNKPYGYFLLGKLWNNEFIKEIENITGFNINLIGVEDIKKTNVAENRNYGDILITKPISDWKNNTIANIEFVIYNQLKNDYRYFGLFSAFISVLSIIIIILFFIAVRYWINNPLASITESLNTENVTLLAKIIHKKNEFGKIARLISQFYLQKKKLENEIHERLNAENNLKLAKSELENKVAERTNDLLFINRALQAEIAERENAEKIIKKQLEDLEAKNIEMERFTYTVSHDLKSPLITINGFAGLILEKIKNKDYDELETDILRVMNATAKMQELLRDLLELSKIGRIANPDSTFNMTEIAAEVVELLEGILKDKQINIIIQQEMPQVTADRQRIKEVLQNLVENAVKFMDKNENPFIKVGSKQIGNETVFFVEDNGRGIEEKYHKKIFGLFEKLDKHSDGTGIGLALVKRIIELHNGKIWMDSQPGKGSTFYFTLRIE